MRERLRLDATALDVINDFLLDPENPLVNDLLAVIDEFGTPEQINAKARQARQLPKLMARLRDMKSPYLGDVEWLIKQRDQRAFITVDDYRRRVLGDRAGTMSFDQSRPVTLEISALQYFPWLVAEAKQALERQELMPGRYIRVRRMQEQEADQGDLPAVAAAMQIIGATYVETLDTKGTDGSNVHLGGPATITGYFAGIGQPNEYALKWIREFLYYYTEYGVPAVLNFNFGTILLSLWLYRLGVDISLKISVFAGHDNPYFLLWTFLMARIFARPDGSTPITGLNPSNSVNNRTLELSALARKRLGFEEWVRLEHHIIEAYKSIVRQPYDRRQELLELATQVANVSAKHEGGEVAVEAAREHPSDILDYFRSKEEIMAAGDMAHLERNYLDKHDAVNRTARALTERGLTFVAARHLHG
ncbi:MAG TPA: hypothetical protein DCM14_02425 [Clostridiales bacterium UBA8153]|nr:hypothetical protein [Clostridiales bacterium UBA8153]